MSAQDFGNLADYILNGDNYQRVDSTGTTLVIPGKYGKTPLIATSTKDTYRPIIPDCPSGECVLFGHDIFTGQYVLLKIADFDPQIETCICALAGVFEQTDCAAKVQAFVDSQSGRILFEVFPQWLLQELNLTGVQFSATVEFDFWFIACYGALEVFPNLPNTTPLTCPPPGMIQLINGVPVCMMDPPIPNPFPRHFRPSQRAMRFVPSRHYSFSPSARALNPTVRPGVPRIMKSCGCESTPDFEEAIS